MHILSGRQTIGRLYLFTLVILWNLFENYYFFVEDYQILILLVGCNTKSLTENRLYHTTRFSQMNGRFSRFAKSCYESIQERFPAFKGAKLGKPTQQTMADNATIQSRRAEAATVNETDLGNTLSNDASSPSTLDAPLFGPQGVNRRRGIIDSTIAGTISGTVIIVGGVLIKMIMDAHDPGYQIQHGATQEIAKIDRFLEDIPDNTSLAEIHFIQLQKRALERMITTPKEYVGD